MSEYLTEQEQIQQLKNWVKQYGFTILLGIAIALIITGGWRYWQNYTNKISLEASVTYDEMLALRAQNNQAANVPANKLITLYSKTPYAQLAALMNARDAVQKNNYPEAIAKLNWVIDNGREAAIREIARLRLARIFITQKKADAALEILTKIKDKSFFGLVDEIRGDAYLEKNDIASARNSYRLALKEIPNAEIARPVLQMKYDNLAN